MPSDPDRYDEAYAAKLWNLIPAIYRAEDAAEYGERGPLEELVERIGAQIAVVRRSVDRLWEDQSIETCDDWVIDYLGELVGTNLVASLDARGRRLDVGKTLYYRRRKGTVALLEELATDVTGWSARVVEMFRRLGRTRHGLDPAIGAPALPAFSRVTHTGASTGTVTLGGAPLADHGVAVRIDAAGQVGVARWSTSIDGGAWISHDTAATATLDAPGGGTVAVTLVQGSAAPSFVAGDTFSFAITADPVIRLQRAQGLIGVRTRTAAGGLADLRSVQGAALTNTAFDEYFHTADVRRGHGATGWHDIPRLGVFVWRLRSLPVEQVTPVPDRDCPNQYTFDPTGRDVPLFAAGDRPRGDQWTSPQAHQLPGPITAELWRHALAALYRPSPETPDDRRSLAIYQRAGRTCFLIPASEVSADPRQSTGKPWIDPARGRIVWPTAPGGGPFAVDYHAGFSSEIGAGAYDRPPPTAADALPSPTQHLAGGGAVLADALDALRTTGAPGGVVKTLMIDDSFTYDQIAELTGIRNLALRADDQRRPLVRLPESTAAWVLGGAVATADQPGATLVLDGLFLSGGDLVLRGAFDTVTLSCCTLDPGTWGAATWATAADGRTLAATRLRIEGHVGTLILDRCITGPIATANGGRIEKLAIRETIVQDAAVPASSALALTSGEVALSRTTLLGPAQVHRLDASECILHDVVTVEDTQHGCVRFSAWPDGSVLPRRYESVMVAPLAGLFTALDVGHPAYAQLLATASGEITEGAENGSEMGAFWREANAVKQRSLLIKYQEYLPLGLEPVVIHVT